MSNEFIERTERILDTIELIGHVVVFGGGSVALTVVAFLAI